MRVAGQRDNERYSEQHFTSYQTARRANTCSIDRGLNEAFICANTILFLIT
jgi:hypothetical protein